MREPKYRLAGARVAGLLVLDDVPNTDSISASMNEYRALRGIRVVPFSSFPDVHGKAPSYYSNSERERTLRLAQQITASREIKPLIVVVDTKGPYVLEGAHRFDALRELGIKRFPALVVIDLD